LKPRETFPEEQALIEKLQIRNILCPVDFSDFSRRAFQYAVSLARHFGARLFLQHTAQVPTNLLLEGVGPGIEESVQSQLRHSREEIRRMLVSTGIDFSEVTILLNEGDVADRILETIGHERIDLLIMGTHGHKGFSRLVLGSVTEGMIHQAVCPVLVVSRSEGDIADPEQGVRFRTILLATDFSHHSDRALTYALKWAWEWNSKVVLFHAVEKPAPAMQGLVDLFPEYNPYFEQQVARAWERIRDLVPQSARERQQVVYEVRHGNPKEEILRVAEEKRADLIITGARGMERSAAPWGSVSFAVGEEAQAAQALHKTFHPWGSVSSAVVRDGRFPVLVVRELTA
jgi:nucleotide-binding universal stress UspA family protein